MHTRMTTSLKRSLAIFSCLCGESAYSRIALGTTKWPPSGIGFPVGPGAEITYISPRDEAESRFSELENDYWNDLTRLKSRTYRIDTLESALQLVRSILDELELTTGGGELVLQIQKEVVDEGKAVFQTKAGKILEAAEGGKNRYTGMTKWKKAAIKGVSGLKRDT